MFSVMEMFGVVFQLHFACSLFNEWRVATNILNKQPRTYDKGWSALGMGMELTICHCKKSKIFHENPEWTSDLKGFFGYKVLSSQGR
jgi:hypothetical protein